MKQYAIYEGNMERLTKKMARIQNKCKKYGCEFTFREVGEEYRKLKDDNEKEYVARFVLVEAEGTAVVNGWKFIASVEHTDNGNIINRACDVEVPEKYYTGTPICEHCNSKRYRKYTYIVMNEETGEFKQVGKSCLKDFTRGMSAEGVAEYTAAFDELIKGEEPYLCGYGAHYYEIYELLLYVAETIKHFGYAKSDSIYCTKNRAFNYYQIEHNENLFNAKEIDIIKEEMASVNFKADTPENNETVKNALKWIAKQDDSNNYMHNLKTVCGLEYVTRKNIGILASLFPTYSRALQMAEKEKEAKEVAKQSNYIGNVGERIEVKAKSFECVTSWDTQFGVTRIYKIVDNAGNVFTWKTSKCVEEDKIQTIKGTIKEHTEYRGVKQTELTRCKVS